MKLGDLTWPFLTAEAIAMVARHCLKAIHIVMSNCSHSESLASKGGIGVPPMVYSLLLTWFRSLRMASWMRRLIGGAALAIICIACLPYFLHAGPAPAWLGEIAGQVAANQGMYIQVKEMRLEGWGRATLNDVVFRPRSQLPELEEVRAERVILIFDWLPLMRGQMPQVRDIRIEKPVVTATLPGGAWSSAEPPTDEQVRHSPSTSPAEAKASTVSKAIWRFPIRFQVRDGQLRLQGGTFGPVVAEFDMKGRLMEDGLRIDQSDFEVESERFTGLLHGAGRLEWAVGSLQIAGSARGEHIRFTIGEDVYRIERLEANYRYDGGTWMLDAFGNGRGGSRIDVSGTISEQEGMLFNVNAAGLNLAADIPFVARYGFEGESAFSGTLSGTFRDFVLEGEATIGSGFVWGRPHRQAKGYIAVTPEYLAFTDVRVEQEVGRYDLDGVYMFARPEEAFPGYLEITLDTRAGRLIDLLAILEADHLPLSGRLNGSLTFSGSLGSVGAEGDVEVLDAEVWGQPFDRISGAFAWADGQIHLHEVDANLGTGRLRADGTVLLNDDQGSMDLRFTASDWPLGEIHAFEARFGRVAGGRIDVVDGRLTGSLAEPVLSAQVMSDGLRLGPTAFRDVRGAVRLATDGLTVEGLTAVRSGGGTYQVAGVFRPDASERIVTETTIVVEGEDLRDLLQLMGQPLPAAVLNGLIRGEIAVSGPLANPHATLSLLWADTVEANSGIELVLVLEQRELRVERFGFIENPRPA